MLDERDRHATYRQWRWWSVALRGLFAVIFGLFALGAPKSAFFSLVMLFGIFALVDGVLALSFGTRTKVLPRGAIMTRGIISIVAGVLALTMPGPAGLALLILIGAWAIVSGVSELYMAIKLRNEIEHEWLLGIEGALSVAFGIMLLISPLAGAIVLGLWVGAFALVLGGMMIATGFRLRGLQHHVQGLRTAAA